VERGLVSDIRNERLAQIYDADGEPVEMKIDLDKEAAN
jgi:hypothetical protein